ncbi:MAG TPA: hypothetical protein VJ964_02185, partial [Balneolaceae bacterium]|nr:hypothetical protein [Balneolaceae bacterium]
GFVETGTQKSGKLEISFTKDQLDVLNKTRSMVLDFTFSTTKQQAVKIRATDAITFRLAMSADVTSTVN